MMRTLFVFVIALAVTALLGGPAGAGTTLLEKDFVGDKENALKKGGGNYGSATDEAARFAGSTNSIAEGPPTGNDRNRGGSDIDSNASNSKRESFLSTGTLPVIGELSLNEFPVRQNIPTCPDPLGGIFQAGAPASYSWRIELERIVVSDIAVQICLDVRRCQEEDDLLGPTNTVSINDQILRGGLWEAPLYLRIKHEAGPLQSYFGGTRYAQDLTVPELERVGGFPDFPDLGVHDDPAQFEDTVLEESISLIGRDCITKWIPNAHQTPFAVRDYITVDLKVPSSTRVRVRASQDSVALVYLGTPLPGEDL